MCICMCMYVTFIQHDLPRKFQYFPAMFKSHLQPVHMHCSVGHPAATAAVAPSLAEPRLASGCREMDDGSINWLSSKCYIAS